ncbi:peptidase M14 carboxypeptidase A [Granulicella tundricola MP5ACTX9]|uniref:Peptidase M14 carboxypeptidase A n=2 Tax=Granulicella TaxID=940557 RepID=E8WVZ9_GRATM|nr:peptidase M14 carboxypeptidase A [Granulicella tundricola MP5ACTX9]
MSWMGLGLGVISGVAGGQTVAHESLLGRPAGPTGCHWTAGQQEWLTPSEKGCYATTPDYDETMGYLRRVQGAAPGQVKIEGFGKTGEGRELDVVVVSKDGLFDPAAIHAAKRPIVLVQNSIHAGEMDGKDSCLALLRDMVILKTKAKLLERAVFVFIPMYNADGHERRGAFNRINQDGPAQMGWRGNGTNLNLNRDYLKADTPEAKAFMGMYQRWNPDFFVDDHVTDGADFQYDVTFSIDDGPNVPKATAAWADKVGPEIVRYIDGHGHVGLDTYVELLDEKDLRKGIAIYDDPPRFSTGYVTLTGRPAMLIELHMLKDYKVRVEGNYEALVGLLEIVNRDADKLLALNAAADEENTRWAGKVYPLAIGASGKTEPIAFKGYAYKTAKSEVSGGDWVQYSHVEETMTIPQQVGYKVEASAVAPVAYIVPRQWVDVIDRLAAHGVAMERTTAAWTAAVDTYKCSGMQWQEPPFEGRHPTFNGEASRNPGKYGECVTVKETRTFPAGSAVVKIDQRLAPVAMSWLEPAGPDSALQWGLFDSIFEQKEYGEAYVVERLAREMMAADPKLKAEFEAKVAADPVFAKSAAARLDFFYQRSEFGKANGVGAYPVGRLDSLAGVPLGR